MVTERVAFVFLTLVFGLYVIVTNDIGTRFDVNWLINARMPWSSNLTNTTNNKTALRADRWTVFTITSITTVVDGGVYVKTTPTQTTVPSTIVGQNTTVVSTVPSTTVPFTTTLLNTTVSTTVPTTARVTTEIDDIPTDAFDGCVLKVYDPFYKGINKVVDYKNPLKDCNQKFHPPTELIDGNVTVHPDRAKEFDGCSASCLYYVTSTKTKEGEWQNFTKDSSVKMDCDFIWTKCYKKDKEIDQGIHMQVKEVEEETTVTPTPTPTAKTNTPPPTPKEPQRQPNVYIIIVDSVASTQALRSLSKTVDFLKKNMSGVFFHHLNKNGDNSRPNGYAFTMGKRIIDMDRSVVGAPNLEAEMDREQICHTYRDNDSVIIRDYHRAGFKTLYAEDYPSGTVYTWPSCWGFEKQPSTHSFRPYTAINTREKLLKANNQDKNCYELSRESMRYTGMFMKAYKDKPKFGLTWVATISHDDANLLFHEDDYFESFFKENEPYLRDSFVFFMGDHGMRWGSTYKTELGKRELKNPFLVVTVPEFSRSNDKFMGTLEENSMKLITQFEMHATFVDLLKFAPKSNFNDFNFTTIFEKNPNNATSILRPLRQFSRRSCKNIPVPFQYCLCEYDMQPIDNADLATTAHKYLTTEINQILKDNNVSGNCSHLIADKIINFQAFAPEYPNRLYEIEFSVTPGGGEFKALIHYDEARNRFKIKGEIERLNAYGMTAKCLNHIPVLKSYCYCLVQG